MKSNVFRIRILSCGSDCNRNTDPDPNIEKADPNPRGKKADGFEYFRYTFDIGIRYPA